MKKLLFSTALVLALLIGQTGIAFAQDATPISGVVQSVTLETDTAGTTTVLVAYTYVDSAGAQQTATSRLSVEAAASLGLVTTDPATNTTTVNDAATGSTVTIDPGAVIPDPVTEETPQHPVGSALSDFFSDLLGVDYDTIMEYHSDGTGFGVIAQALWLTSEMGGGTDMFTALLDAKKSGDYSAITLADGSTPSNWGDVVKSLKKGDNLGSVKSGHADSSASDTTSDTTSAKQSGGNGNSGNSGSGGSNGSNNGSSNGNGNGKGNAGGKGNGKP